MMEDVTLEQAHPTYHPDRYICPRCEWFGFVGGGESRKHTPDQCFTAVMERLRDLSGKVDSIEYTLSEHRLG